MLMSRTELKPRDLAAILGDEVRRAQAWQAAAPGRKLVFADGVWTAYDVAYDDGDGGHEVGSNQMLWRLADIIDPIR